MLHCGVTGADGRRNGPVRCNVLSVVSGHTSGVYPLCISAQWILLTFTAHGGAGCAAWRLLYTCCIWSWTVLVARFFVCWIVDYTCYTCCSGWLLCWLGTRWIGSQTAVSTCQLASSYCPSERKCIIISSDWRLDAAVTDFRLHSNFK